jgi:hypothetical protein
MVRSLVLTKQRNDQKVPKVFQILVGVSNNIYGPSNTINKFRNVTRNQVKYYTKKVNMNIHWGLHGGLRENNYTVDDENLKVISQIIEILLHQDPTLLLEQLGEWIYLLTGFKMKKS